MRRERKENKGLKIFGNVIYTICTILILMFLFIVILQRVSNNEISIGGIRIFNVITQSMEPKYNVGDILVSKYIEPSNIEVGDDVVYLGQENSYEGKVITHRVIEKKQEDDGTYTFHTKGIANDLEDPQISGENIYGVIVYKIQTLSLISKLINNVYKFYFLIFIPIVIIIFVEIMKIIRNKNNDDENDDEDDEEENEEDKK